ncbi:MAG: oligosaccharide flippase family protein [Desulfomonile tiedjei]|uniref:Oligosaccharide flippase family protein n=1 Tax=Desulfomonile tiedjei TaxID=2358 RepID=A0A9D6Z575_9BACT|nr:oligosaccharide flippase family protein [Desulfomonile tiedjei]
MSQFKWNIAANYFGRGWLGVTNLLCVPLYAKFMGVESYGLVGFFGVLQSSFLILEIGLYTTLNRELARLAKAQGSEEVSRDVVRTLETIYWMGSVLIAVIVYLIAPYVAVHWLKTELLPTSTLETAIMLMGIAMALEGPHALYNSGLMGLQKQVLVNCISSVFITLRCFGAIAVLWGVSPTIEAYLWWQIPVSAARTLTTAVFLQKNMPSIGRRARFDKRHFRALWKFSLGVSGAAILTLLLTQGDKILLSKMLTLETFGYYNLAWVLGFSLVGLLVDPIKDASFPRFSQLAEANEIKSIADLYHLSCQAATVVLAPVSLVVVFFAYDIVLAWTGMPTMAQKTCSILELLIIGMALRGLMTLPTTLQLAYGWTRLMIGMNVVAVIIFMPLVTVLAVFKGSLGAASAWVVLYAGYVFFGITLMHRRILKGEERTWYVSDVGLPLFSALAVVYLGRCLAPDKMTMVTTLMYLALVLIVSMVAASLAGPKIRKLALRSMGDAWRFFFKRGESLSEAEFKENA